MEALRDHARARARPSVPRAPEPVPGEPAEPEAPVTTRRRGRALFTPSIQAAILLIAAIVPVVLASGDAARSPFLYAIAAFAVVLVIYHSSTLTSDLLRERSMSVKLDEALAQVIEHRDELEAQRQQLQRLALNDDVTGLGNRVLLRNLGAALGPDLADATLLLLDLDRFKEVNDTLGHSLGDDLLRQVAERLGPCIRANDTLVRLGGDEFAVLLPDTGAWVAARTADRVLDVLRRPFVLDGQAVQVRGSVGIAAGGTASGLDELLRNADLAMYQAKAAGRDRSCEFDPGMMSDSSRLFSLGVQVRDALGGGDFRVYYQPIVDAPTGRVVSLEALVRWEHPDRGVMPPSEFLTAAHQTGLIVELGQFVLRTACEQTVLWRRKWPWLTVAVNVSQRELVHPEFAAQVAGVLATTGLAPEALYLEVTETVLAAEEQITAVLQPLTDMGVRCSLDDFGTGYSSLSRLRQLPVDRIKIDRSFVMDITGEDSEGAPLLVSIIGLAHSLGLSVVAEGVETEQQADFLAAHGCEELQGYYFSRPLPSRQVPGAFVRLETRV
jgi:diguanylate cyclase (GGDEF)-like protein